MPLLKRLALYPRNAAGDKYEYDKYFLAKRFILAIGSFYGEHLYG